MNEYRLKIVGTNIYTVLMYILKYSCSNDFKSNTIKCITCQNIPIILFSK